MYPKFLISIFATTLLWALTAILFSFFIGCAPIIETLRPSDLSPEEIKIASFNIEQFNVHKLTNETVRNILIKIIREFDIVAIQEVGMFQGGTNIIPQFLSTLNQQGEPLFEAVTSDKLGTGGETERNSFFYKKELISLKGSVLFSQITNFPHFTRSPFLVHFVKNDFEFILASVHTKPTLAAIEIQYLTNIFERGEKRWPNLPIIVLGDLNADGGATGYFDEKTTNGIRDQSRFTWVIGDHLDTTVSKGNDFTYDRIVFKASQMLKYYRGECGVLLFEHLDRSLLLGSSPTNLPPLDPLLISDHYPVYATFHF